MPHNTTPQSFRQLQSILLVEVDRHLHMSAYTHNKTVERSYPFITRVLLEAITKAQEAILFFVNLVEAIRRPIRPYPCELFVGCLFCVVAPHVNPKCKSGPPKNQ